MNITLEISETSYEELLKLADKRGITLATLLTDALAVHKYILENSGEPAMFKNNRFHTLNKKW